MRNNKLALSLLLTVLLVYPCIADAETIIRPANWPWRGMVVTSASLPNADDLKYLADIHVNAIEIHLDVRLVAQRMKISPSDAMKHDIAWADAMINGCKKYGISAIISIFQIPTDPAIGISQESPDFWDNPGRLKEAIDIASMLAEHYRDRGAELGAYSILSEPVVQRKGKPELPSAWQELVTSIIKAIRKYDANRYIMVTQSVGGMPNGYAKAKPVDDPYIIYNAHMYVPHPYTHQGISGNPLGPEYPGRVNLRYWDKHALEEFMSPLVQFQKKYNVLVFVGEFSAVRWAPGSEQYLKDLIDIFDSNGWGWVYFQYKSFHGWDPDYDSVFSNNQEYKKHYVGRNTARWELLRDAFTANKARGAAVP